MLILRFQKSVLIVIIALFLRLIGTTLQLAKDTSLLDLAKV